MDSYYTVSDERYSSAISSHMSYPAFSYPQENTYDGFDYYPSQYVQPTSELPDCPPQLPLHAPIPISGYSTLIAPPIPLSPTPPTPVGSTSPTTSPHDSPSSSQGSSSGTNPLDIYGNAPQVTFPTPSELLTDLAACGRNGTGLSDLRPPAPASSSEPASVDEAAPATKKTKSGGKHAETQRKVYFRAVAESVGFQPTDPDTITSHDKKRSYLECLEQYVQWLHGQIRLVGHEPVAFERVPKYRGLNSRSIRTLLVHMQDEARKLHQQTLEDERTFTLLQQQVTAHQSPDTLHAFRRHSVPSEAFLPSFYTPHC
ncbi:hypothetical protein BKA93DRAFT_745790 [Sparassis latifolia]